MDNHTISGLVFYCGESSNGKVKLCDQLIGKQIYELSYYKKHLVALCPDAIYDILDGDEFMKNCNICQLSNGKLSTIGLSTDNSVYSWGEGHKGELGLGLCANTPSPVKINKLKGTYESIASGPNHTMLCNTDGQVYGFGHNLDKQLALYNKVRPKEDKTLRSAVDDFIFAPRFVPFSFIRPVQMVACGSNFTVFLTRTEGRVYTCGSGDCGQLGIGSLCRVEIPTRVEFVNESDNVHIVNIACGFAHVLCYSSTGSLYSFGLNSHGQLGCDFDKKKLYPNLIKFDIESSDSISKLFADGNCSAALTNSGSLLTWGSGRNYRLFQVDDANVFIPKKAALLEDQNVGRFAFGPSGSSVCVASILKSISPDSGPVVGLESLTVAGNGLWDSGKVLVKFSSADNECISFVCDATVVDGKIKCEPKEFPQPGVYHVTTSLNGESYLPGVASLYVHPVLRIMKPVSSITNRKISSIATYRLAFTEDSSKIPYELLSRDAFVKLQLSLAPFTNKLTTNVCRRETLTVKGRFVDATNQGGSVIEVSLDFTSTSLFDSSDAIYIRPSISLNGINYSRYAHDSTAWLTHGIMFQDRIADRCLMDLIEDDPQFDASRSFVLSATNMIPLERLPLDTSIQVVFTAHNFPAASIALPLDASQIKNNTEISLTPPRIIDFYNLYLASIDDSDMTDDEKQKLTIPTHIKVSYRFELVFRPHVSKLLSSDDEGSICEEEKEEEDDNVKLSMKSMSMKLIKEVVEKVSLSALIGDDVDEIDLSEVEVDNAATKLESIDISEGEASHHTETQAEIIVVDASDASVPICIDLDFPPLSVTKYTPHNFVVSPQHIRIQTSDDVFVAIEGLHYEPATFHVGFMQGGEVIRQVPSNYSSNQQCGFYLPSDILHVSQLSTINQLYVCLVLDPESSAIWPVNCSPTISLYSQMSLAGGGKSKPGSNVQFTISQFRLVDGLATLNCLVRIREALPTAPANDDASPAEDVYLDVEGIITSATKEVAKGKPPGPLITKVSFTAPSLNDLINANMAVDKKFPKGDKRKAGSYFVGVSIDDGKSFDFTEKALLEIK